MGHIRDCISYSSGTSITTGCFVTGKPVVLGGIVGRREATGNGVVAPVAAACECMNLPLPKLRVAVQGFGNVGSVTALAIANLGATVVAVSDMYGGTSVKMVWMCRNWSSTSRPRGKFPGSPAATDISAGCGFEADCDILIPAAADSSVTEENAGRIRARLVAEGANAPLTPEADEILKPAACLSSPTSFAMPEASLFPILNTPRKRNAIR